MCCSVLLEAVEGELCSLEVMRCMLLCVLDAVEGGLTFALSKFPWPPGPDNPSSRGLYTQKNAESKGRIFGCGAAIVLCIHCGKPMNRYRPQCRTTQRARLIVRHKHTSLPEVVSTVYAS